MKRFFYSTYTKVFGVILFLASLTLGVLSGIHGAALLNEEDNYIYDFGSTLEESWYFHHLVGLPENTVLGTIHEMTYYQNDSLHDVTEETTEPMPPTIFSPSYSSTPLSEATWEQIYSRIDKNLRNLPYLDYIRYYVNLNGEIFSNAAVTDPALLIDGVYKYYHREKTGQETFYRSEGSYYQHGFFDYNMEHIMVDDLVVVTQIRPEYVTQCRALWDKQETVLYTTGARVLVCALLLLLSLIYLICVCGRDAGGNRKSGWTDRIWAEFHLLFMGGAALGCILACIVCVDAAFEKQFPMDGAYLIPGLLVPIAGGVILSSLLSMIRNLKAGLFAKRCILLILLQKLLSWLWTFCKATWHGLRYVGRTFASIQRVPFTVMQIGLLLIYTLATLLFTAMIDSGAGIGLVLLLLLYGTAAFFLARKEKDMGDIQKGTSRIRNGDLTHRIPEPKSLHLKALVEDVNQIAGGLDASLAGRMKAERMKTELITNVSHDLKTPLTSIINYTELLSKVEDLPEEARDYISIIESKSLRLKDLTQDLFTISKAQSGNEEVNWELLDAAILLEQSLAEEQGEELTGNLQFCLKAEEGLTFMADGRKLSRVLGNLIRNATKYAMPGTRVFLSAYKEDGRVVMECKNVSAYPLDFSPEEILGRFVRGDSSRSTEGNGLGLPIAKTYTELCGGNFDLILDGDLFKVLLSFPLTQ